jgi:hypothetical protein
MEYSLFGMGRLTLATEHLSSRVFISHGQLYNTDGRGKQNVQEAV